MQTQSYNRFWQRIHKSARDKNFPLRVMFELTYRCNFYCRHCYVPSNYRKKKGELKTKEVFFVLEQLRDIGCFYLGFTGGEPFVREDIMEILWYAKRCGFEVIIYTNGSLIDEKIAHELARLRPNKVDITIPAMSKHAFERISGVSGFRDKVFQTIELLHKKGVNLGFKSCVLKENEDEIKEIQKFAESLGALHRLDNILCRRLDGSDEPYKYRGSLAPVNPLDRCNSTELVQITNTTEITSKTNSTKITSLFKCGVGENQVAITPFGELKMCLMIDKPKYKILETSLKECWERLKELVKDIKPNEDYKCPTCKLKNFCNWCPAKSWLQSKSFVCCEAESRRWAELRMFLHNEAESARKTKN